MSCCLDPIAVDLACITPLLGAGDASLAPTLVSRYRSANQFENEEAELTLEQAVRDLLLGNEMPPNFSHNAYLYGYAFEAICEYFGRHLFNNGWTGMSVRWIDTVDRALRGIGVSDDDFGIAKHLVYRGPPVPIPLADDLPAIGYLLAAEIPGAMSALEAVPQQSLDEEVQESLGEVYDWLSTCRKEQRDLVCFLA